MTPFKVASTTGTILIWKFQHIALPLNVQGILSAVSHLSLPVVQTLRQYLTVTHVCRIITANFLHDSFVHLCLSSYALLTIAPEAEAVLGPFAFLTTYVLGGAAGTTLCFLLTDTLTVGASSGIFGLIGMPHTTRSPCSPRSGRVSVCSRSDILQRCTSNI